MARSLQGVLEAVLDGLIVIDEQGLVEQLNGEACRILECSAEAARGLPVERLQGEEHMLTQLAHRVLENGRPVIVDDVPILRRLDRNLEVDVAVSALLDGGVVVALRDRTVRNTLREEATQRERLDSYGHIAAGIAHEVKNPLGGIRGAAELLSQRGESDRNRRAAHLIVQEVDRIASLVDELMVFARGDNLVCHAVNLHLVLDGVLDLLSMDALGQEVRFERIYDPSIPELIGDSDRLTQVFLNLARNALQAMEGLDPAQRSLRITTRMALDHRLADPAGRSVPTVSIRIQDRGCGIDPEDLERLATPFFTTRPKGTGLGLAVSKHWLNRHGGVLRFESEPGRGTTARVLLPLEGPHSALAPAPAPSREQERKPA